MFGLARKPAENTAARAVNLYFSNEAVVVAATYQSANGIYFEQAGAKLLQGAPSNLDLGHAFQHAFRAFTVGGVDLRSLKKSDWPAFQASGLRSVKQFEDIFRKVSCCSLNSSNAVVRASTSHARDSEIELSISFNPLLSAEVIGGQLQRLVAATNAT